MLLIIIFHNYFWPQPWPQLAEIGLGLVAKIARPRGFGLVQHHWSLHFKFLLLKMESVQRFSIINTKRLQSMWNKRYNDRLRLMLFNTYNLKHRRLYSIYSNLVSMFPAIK